MSGLDWTAAIAGLGAILAAIAFLIRRVPVASWFSWRREDDVQDRSVSKRVEVYVQAQLEQEQRKRDQDAERHRYAIAALKAELEAKIARLERHIDDLQSDLSQSHVYNAKLMADLDQSQSELRRAREAYEALIASIPTILARRLGEEEKQ